MRHLLLLGLGALCAAPAAAQGGTLDQVSPSSNVAFNSALPGWSRQQDVLVGVAGQLEGISFDVASPIPGDSATIKVYLGWAAHSPTATPLFTGQVLAAGPNQTTVFVDMTAANIQLAVDDPLCVEFVADSQQMTTYGNSGWPSPLYPWDFHENDGVNGWVTGSSNTRLGLQTYMLTGPTGPTLTLNAPCPGSGTVEVAGATPGATVGLAWSTTTGSFTLNGTSCAGTTIDLVAPRPLLIGPADANGDWVRNVSVPAAICGAVSIQALDFGSCTATNVVGV